MKKMNWLSTVFVLLATQASAAWNLGVETDILHPALHVGERVLIGRSWISPRFYFMDHFHLGAELFYENGGATSGSAQGPTLGERTVGSHYNGASVGYYSAGYLNSSFKVSAAAGAAQRKFTDSFLGIENASGSFWLGEVGYQWIGRLGVFGLSLVSMDSDLQENVSFKSGANQSAFYKSNTDTFLKVSVGVIF